MILPHVQIPALKNHNVDFYGSDTKLTACCNEYPEPITYTFNSRGFRDEEWPLDLHNALWCIGDSQTLGVGSAVSHTWPKILQKKTQRRTINVSMTGASNDWISRMSREIYQVIHPKIIVHQWSFIHRREKIDERQQCQALWFDPAANPSDDVDNCIKNILSTSYSKTMSIHSFVPTFEPIDVPERLINETNLVVRHLKSCNHPNVVYYNNQIDNARDGMHYDQLTANEYVNQIFSLLKKASML